MRLTIFLLFLSCFSFSQKDTLLKIPEPLLEPIYDSAEDGERAKRNRPICDSCERVEKKYSKLKYEYFIKFVYDSAMKYPGLSTGNRAFLEKLKSHLSCKTSCGSINDIIRPVFQLKDRNGINAYRIIDDPHGKKTAKGSDTLSYRLVYSNKKTIDSFKIVTSKYFRGACISYYSHVLKKTKEENKVEPAFCTPYTLELEYVSDKKTNKLLKNNMKCNNACSWYCDPETQQVTFAKLKGVPNLYFTCDTNEWGVWYPARGMFINIKNKYALQLWKFALEMVECSCI